MKILNHGELRIGLNCKLSLDDIYQFANKKITIKIGEDTYSAIKKSNHFLNSCVEQRIPIYGINTHFGDQVNFVDCLKNNNSNLYYESINARQENLIKSHACGLGDSVSIETVKVCMLLRLHCLVQGYSGVSIDLIEAILSYIDAGIIPIVRRFGSIGASGDLIPLASIAAAILGEEVDVIYQNRVMKAPEAIAKAGLSKFKPQLRDGLAMMNGTSFMTAIAGLALYNLKRLFKQLLSAVAMSLESLLVISSAYHPLVHQLKEHLGEIEINNFLLDFWQGSSLLINLDELRHSHIEKEHLITINEDIKPIQDFYSLRSVSQGFGPWYENLEKAIIWVENEMNSVNDNPIIDAHNNKIYHSANFMGYYITDACDIMKMNIAQASTWLHALLANMVHPRKNHGLPANLIEKPGAHNGFRPLQLLAASLTIQNRKLAQSHQAYMLPTEGDNQDVNSLGTHAALDMQDAVVNLERLTAIVLLAAVQALELRGIQKSCKKSQEIFQLIRQSSPKLSNCRPLTEEIENVVNILQQERI